MATAQSSQQNAQQQNALARQIILATAVDRIQQIYSQTIDTTSQSTVNINPRNVGLIKGFFVDIEMTVTAGSATEADLTNFGPANAVKKFVFTDLQNNTRINATGWFVHMLNTARNNKPFGISNAFDTSPIGYGENYDEISADAKITDTDDHTVKMRYYIPLAYSNTDLRGAVFGSVVNATMNLQIELNTSAFVSSGDATEAIYSGNSGTTGDTVVTVYQYYLDQLPTTKAGYVLPIMDMSTFYDIKTTSVNGMVANQDYPIPYANYRSFLSTSFIYDNGGTLSAGTDINYIKLQSANFTDVFKMSPIELSLLSRLQLGTDYPTGSYYVSHRNKPINTNQYGNMELVINPKTVNSDAQVLVGYEAFGQISIMNQAGSLPAAG